MSPDKSRKVTVCDACLTAACWHGSDYCQRYRTAAATERTVAELDALGRESSDNYSTERVRKVCG